MTPVILDTSVTIAWLLPDEPLHAQAVALHDQIVAGLVTPIVASHHRFEVRHALVRAAQRSRCAWPELPGYLEDLGEMEMDEASSEVSDSLALSLCRDLRLSWGDSQWVALAIRRGFPLVTADMRLARTVPADVAWIQSLSDRPE